MRGQKEKGDHVPGLGTRTGSTLLFSTTLTALFCDIKQRRSRSFLTSSSIAIKKQNDPIVGSLVRDGSRILYNRGQILHGSFQRNYRY